MKKQYIAGIFLLLFIIVFVSPSFAFFESAEKADALIDKAIEYYEIEEKEKYNEQMKEAKEMIDILLEKNVNDAETLFVSAKYNFYKGQGSKANAQFKKACANNASMCKRHYDLFMSMSKKAFTKGELGTHVALMKKAYSLMPKDKKTKGADEFFRMGSRHLFDGKIDTAQVYYDAAIYLDPNYGSVSTAAIIRATKGTKNPKTQLRLLKTAIKYCDPGMETKILQVAVAIGNDFKKNGIRKATIISALNTIPAPYNAKIEESAWPPDWKQLNLGPNPFAVDKEGATKQWYRPPEGFKSDILFATNHDDYTVLIRTSDGKIKEYGKNEVPKGFWGDMKIKSKKPIKGAFILNKI